jgi:hypothetical protein
MKNNLLFVILIGILSSCSKMNDSLISPYFKESVNSKSGIILKGEKEIIMYGPTSLAGIVYHNDNPSYRNVHYFFNTTDNFSTFEIYLMPKSLRRYYLEKFKIQYNSGNDITAATSVGDSILAIESNDFGKTWKEKFRLRLYDSFGSSSSPAFISSYSSIGSISFLNKDDAIVYLSNYYYGKYAIYRITNNIPTLLGVVSSFPFVYAHYYDFNNAIRYSEEGGSMKVYKTADGGLTWTGPVSFPDDFSWSSTASHHYLKTQFFGSTITVITNKSSYSSNDNGLSWSKIPFGIELRYVHFITSNLGFTFYNFDGYNGDVYKTIDGGITWQKVNLKSIKAYMYGLEVYFVDEDHGYINSSDGFYVTEDGGKHWKLVLYPYAYVK